VTLLVPVPHEEMPEDINNDADVLRKSELIRAHAAVRMGLSASADEATRLRQHTSQARLCRKAEIIHRSRWKAG
jgi:2-methylaconitate cis-trans-isomerase PrpF